MSQSSGAYDSRLTTFSLSAGWCRVNHSSTRYGFAVVTCSVASRLISIGGLAPAFTGWLCSANGRLDDCRHTADARMNGNGHRGAIPRASAALHAPVLVDDSRSLALHLKDRVRADIDTHLAANAPLLIQLKRDDVSEIPQLPHGDLSDTDAPTTDSGRTGSDKFPHDPENDSRHRCDQLQRHSDSHLAAHA